MNAVKVPVLNYHGIDASGSDYRWTDEERVYVISRQRFKEQLDRITDGGFQTVLPNDLARWQAGEIDLVKPLMITFDDGHASHFDHAAALLRERGMKAVFFVSAEWIGKPEFLSPAQLREMAGDEFEIASHGCGHIPLPSLPDAALHHEIYKSKEMLEAWTGREVISFSIPRGFYHRRIKMKVREAGYRFMFTSHFGGNDRGFDPFYLKRMAPTAYTTAAEFEKWIHCDLGMRGVSESVKEYTRQLLGPASYGMLARIKARILAGKRAV